MRVITCNKFKCGPSKESSGIPLKAPASATGFLQTQHAKSPQISADAPGRWSRWVMAQFWWEDHQSAAKIDPIHEWIYIYIWCYPQSSKIVILNWKFVELMWFRSFCCCEKRSDKGGGQNASNPKRNGSPIMAFETINTAHVDHKRYRPFTKELQAPAVHSSHGHLSFLAHAVWNLLQIRA